MRQLIIATILFLQLTSCSKREPGIVIGVTQHRPASWADSVRKGFEQGLRETGWRENQDYKLVYRSADGDPRVMRQIADQFLSDGVNLIFAISTQSAQTTASVANGRIPVLFGAVTDPVAAGLVESLTRPAHQVTGTSDQWPVREQLLLLRELRPTVTRVGIVHNPGESNSVAQLRILKMVTASLDWQLVIATANNPAEVYRAAQTLKGRCDGLYVSADNTAIEAADAMARVAEEAHIPIVAGEDSSVRKGAIATYSVNYEEIGRLNARQAYAILHNHSDPATMPVAVPTTFELVINLSAAQRIGVAVPPSMLRRARTRF
jgi:putative ABC transport system substrate-binding protein